MKTNNEPNEPEEVTLETVVVILTEILGALKTLPLENVQYYDNADLKKMLNASDSTLHRIRKSNLIPHKKIRGKIYYPKSFFNKAFNQ
ncbi:helix-turn-helix domain-containing protein [Kaistella sp. G5-32]|uniref:Helix-turn-helix domain-containing protein n=1 Tax=Kaistella gelatinilytica TaxID=2787636 RepID=A0ABS0F8Y4_9FLAO|nr:helix-turn-helix domain-containing protein [Kaistella gelatinilytica]MBF8456164.1 helix-turn-helix domain-containing protein [Kaistella gelatinilytica]